MADYYPLIARAVEGLGGSTGEARRALYERARAALVAQLRGIDPPLSEADITRERLALEDAIRKVEAETSRRARGEARPAAPPPRSSQPIPRTPAPPAAPPPPQPRSFQPSPRAPAPPAAPSPPPPPLRRERPIPPPGSTMPPRPEPGRTELRRGEPPRAELPRAQPPRVELPRAEPPRVEPPPAPPPLPPRAPLRDPNQFATEPERQPPPLSARNRLLKARNSPIASEGLRGFREVVNEVDELGSASAESAQYARDTRDSYGSNDDLAPLDDRIEPQFDTEPSDLHDDDAAQLRTPEPSFPQEEEALPPPPVARPQAPRRLEPEDHYEEPRRPRSYRGMARLAVVLIIFAGLAATVSWQWSNISALYQFVSHMRSRQSASSTQTPTAEPKFPGRVPQDQTTPGQPAKPGATAQQPGPAVAQRVVLYEEDSNDPQGKRYVGSAIWRTETVSPGSGLAPELQVRADIEIPERHMTVTWTLRRNTDKALPASHTIEIMFNLPPDFAGGGIANVPGVLMKESEQARGVPLAGLAVKVTNGFFLIGLSAVDTDVQRNIQLLKDRPWFDIPIVYNNGGRAILAMEKGPPGDRAFADAFAAWGMK